MTPPKSKVGFADLAQWLAAVDDMDVDPDEHSKLVDNGAKLMGLYRRSPRREPEVRASTPKDFVDATPAAEEVPTERPELKPVPFLMPVEINFHPFGMDDEGDDDEFLAGVTPTAPDELVRPGSRDPQPRKPPLTSWSRLEPYLQKAMRRRGRGNVDVRAAIRRVSRMEVLHRIPRRPRRGWSTQTIVLVDRSDRLMPFWRDQKDLLERVGRCLGGTIDARYLPHGLSPGAVQLLASEIVNAPAVLALSDLGAYAGGSEARAWQSLGARLKREWVERAALVPAPADRWSTSNARLWHARLWDRSSSPVAVVGADRQGDRKTLDGILTLLSFATRIEPGFLRAVRTLLPQHRAGVGLEHDVWHHADVMGDLSGTAVLKRSAARMRWPDFASHPDAEYVVGLMRNWHSPLQAWIWLEEVLALWAEDGGNVAQFLRESEINMAVDQFRSLARALDRESLAQEKPAISVWIRKFVKRLPGSLWKNQKTREALAALWAAAHEDVSIEEAPTGIDWSVVTRGRSGRPRTVELYQDADGFCVAPPGAVQEGRGPRSRVATLWLRAPLVQIWTGRDRTAPPIELEDDRASIPLVPIKKPIHLATDRTKKLSIQVEQRGERLPENRPSWARAMGRDEAGLWCEIEVGDVRHRLRWIPPGRFWMGSPLDETDRTEREGPRHLVTITRGFWLGEVPCTQGLWSAVMGGENPSYLQNDKTRDDQDAVRPVEQVSWEDCQRFLGRLADALNADGWRLPTEAEWEYACRAGTQTATYGGGWKSDSEASSVLDEIAWWSGNSEGRTWPVGAKRPNDWGLHDMLGNVDEWCADGLREYDKRAVADPSGSTELGAVRVFRGGAWLGVAGFVRAASRLAFVPSFRSLVLGFRLARGPAGAPVESG